MIVLIFVFACRAKCRISRAYMFQAIILYDDIPYSLLTRSYRSAAWRVSTSNYLYMYVCIIYEYNNLSCYRQFRTSRRYKYIMYINTGKFETNDDLLHYNHQTAEISVAVFGYLPTCLPTFLQVHVIFISVQQYRARISKIMRSDPTDCRTPS